MMERQHMSGVDSSVSTYTEGCERYTITYWPAAEFKRRTFRCTNVIHDGSGGRVSEMVFEEYTGN